MDTPRVVLTQMLEDVPSVDHVAALASHNAARRMQSAIHVHSCPLQTSSFTLRPQHHQFSVHCELELTAIFTYITL
jgi:hypothetical protein